MYEYHCVSSRLRITCPLPVRGRLLLRLPRRRCTTYVAAGAGHDDDAGKTARHLLIPNLLAQQVRHLVCSRSKIASGRLMTMMMSGGGGGGGAALVAMWNIRNGSPQGKDGTKLPSNQSMTPVPFPTLLFLCSGGPTSLSSSAAADRCLCVAPLPESH